MQEGPPLQRRTPVNDDNVARIVCPACLAVKSSTVGKFRNVRHTVTVKCRCGNTFQVMFEFRKSYRKPTDLSGTYAMAPPASGAGQVKIKNLSLTGLCFEVTGIHDIKVGLKAMLTFTLDDRKKTQINKQVTIRSVQGQVIGVEFHQDRAFEKDLGFYLYF
jgi:hypothetical protein